MQNKINRFLTNTYNYKLMCGIVCLFDAKQKTDILRPQILEMSKKPSPLPDWSGIFSGRKSYFLPRKAIVDPTSGKQPLFTKDGKVVLAVNGEIYNHQELRAEFPDYEFLTHSDCEVILALYRKYGKNFLEKTQRNICLCFVRHRKRCLSCRPGSHGDMSALSGLGQER